jgi:tetratricopeptide (TPR) repeat protein
MKTANFLNCFNLLMTSLLFGVGAAAFAQEEAAQEDLETIALDGRYGPTDGAAGDEADSTIVYDEDAQSYRLVEVEDEEQEVPADALSEEERDTEELRRMFLLYRDALENQDYLEADTLAKRIVELSIKLNGLDSHDSAKALTNLGIAQHNNGDYTAALQNFSASIDIIERIDDRLSEALINPLRGLAATQAATGRADLAQESFQRAVHISHVNEGPHNKEQIQTLESIAELYISAGEYDDAVSVQETMYSIQARNIDPESIDILPALKSQAFWQHRMRMYHRERVSWRQVIAVLEEHYGKESLTLIPPLTSLGKSYLFITPAEFEFQPDSSVASGETYLRRANRIAESNPESNWQIVEQTQLALGDYYILSGRPNRASKIYEETWDLLSEDPERQGNRRDHLENLTVLQDTYPPKYYNGEQADDETVADENFETGTMSFSFSVTPTGHINQIKHLETHPPEAMDFTEVVARSLRHLVYRPRLEDRTMVRTPDVIYTHDFFYRPSDLPLPAEETEIADEEVPESAR